MIKTAFLKSQMQKASAQKRTPPFLRRLIARAVTAAGEAQYGDLASMKCLQLSRITQILLERFGIRSELWLGAFCAPEIYEEWGHDTWSGFWDADHHVWTTTEFYELVDLPARYKHLHPLSSRGDGVPMPAVWWDDISEWPSVIRYLPDTRGKVGFPPGQDADDLRLLEARAHAALENEIANLRVDDITFAPMLTNPDEMAKLHDAGNLWLMCAAAYEPAGLRLPDWIREREAELMDAHREGRRAPSRLAARVDLVRQAE